MPRQRTASIFDAFRRDPLPRHHRVPSSRPSHQPRPHAPPQISTNLGTTLPEAPSPPLQVRELDSDGAFLHFVDSNGERYEHTGQWYRDRNIAMDSKAETGEDERGSTRRKHEERQPQSHSQSSCSSRPFEHSEASVQSTEEEEEEENNSIYSSDEPVRYESSHHSPSPPPRRKSSSPPPRLHRQYRTPSFPHEEEDEEDRAESFAIPFARREERRLPISSQGEEYVWHENQKMYYHPATNSFYDSRFWDPRTKTTTQIRPQQPLPPDFPSRSHPTKAHTFGRRDYHTIPRDPPESSNFHSTFLRNETSSRPPVPSSHPFPSTSSSHVQRDAFGIPFRHVHATTQTSFPFRKAHNDNYTPIPRHQQPAYDPRYDDRRQQGTRERNSSIHVTSRIHVGFEKGRIRVERERYH